MISKFVFEGPAIFELEDGGQAWIAHIDEKDARWVNQNGLFVRVHSWDENKIHENAKTISNKMIRVTIDVVES